MHTTMRTGEEYRSGERTKNRFDDSFRKSGILPHNDLFQRGGHGGQFRVEERS
jgi:hypothetical protein